MAKVEFGKMALIFALTAQCFFAAAAEIENVKFPDDIEVAGQKLVLNGVGLRSKRKFGMNFKVYVAGLYTAERSRDANIVLMSTTPKQLSMSFLRGLDADTLREAWREVYVKNCGSTCTATADKLKEFNSAMIDVQSGAKMNVVFGKESLTVEVLAKEHKSATVDGADFVRNMLAVFIGGSPASDDLKRGLLGQ